MHFFENVLIRAEIRPLYLAYPLARYASKIHLLKNFSVRISQYNGLHFIEILPNIVCY